MNSEQTLNPNGGVCNRRGVEELSSGFQLLERILTPENVQKAWKRVRANKGVPGVEGLRYRSRMAVSVSLVSRQ